MKNIFIAIILILTIQGCKKQQNNSTNTAKELITKMIDKVGSYEDLKKEKNVEYTYTFNNPKQAIKDISTERYIFDGEISWGKYYIHNLYVLPKSTEIITQYYNGKDTTKVANGKTLIKEPNILRASKFLRKANFYWFTMMQKLLDNGLTYNLLPKRTVNKIDYHIIQLGFEKNIGDVQDDFILYMNPKTFLIDQFIFTVKGSKITKPMLMKVEYEKIKNFHLMTKRYVYSSDWNGNTTNTPLFEQHLNNIKFNTKFSSNLSKLLQ